MNDYNDSENDIRYINLYESEGKIYTRKISGFFQSVRRYTGLPLILGYLLLPWFIVDDRPAVLFDLPSRQFHVLWLTFWPQDFPLLAWLLIIAAFSLFTVTVLLGRVWCGFTCPQTVWTLMFIAVEHFFEGDRNKQIKLDQQPWTVEKCVRKGGKHGVWLLIAFVTGVTFIGYFVPIRELLQGFIPFRDVTGMLRLEAHPAATFWTLFFCGMTYLNAGWMREQVCKYMCPYARFQSVMYDTDTLAVHYDEKRGETRGPRKSGDAYQAKGLGDCIDCSWCVQVCPVDIDIRDGLQYECINCGLCVDACNTVMDKLSYPRGLIRFTSEDELSIGHTQFLRPRLFGYCFAVIAMMSAFVYVVATRSPLEVDVIRDRGARMFRIVGDEVQNVYTLKVSNKDQKPHRYRVRIDSESPFEITNYRPIEVMDGETFSLPLRVSIKRDNLFNVSAYAGKMDIMVYVESIADESIYAEEETIFIGPDRR